MAETQNTNAKIKGQNLRILIGDKCVALSTACTLHVGLNLEDSSTKDDTDSWTTQEVTGKSWDVSVDALYGVGTDATGLVGGEALDIVLAGSLVTVKFDTTSGTNNRTAAAQSANPYQYTGQAYINDISVNAHNKQNVTYTVQLTGNGPLAKVQAG